MLVYDIITKRNTPTVIYPRFIRFNNFVVGLLHSFRFYRVYYYFCVTKYLFKKKVYNAMNYNEMNLDKVLAIVEL